MKKIMRLLPPPILQSLTYGFSIALTKGIGFLLIPFLTHYLDPADYGRLDILQTLADLMTIVLACGLGECLFRFAKSENKALIATLYNTALCITLLSIVMTQLGAKLILNFIPGDITLLQLRLILITICFSPSILIPLSWIRLEGKSFIFFKLNVGRTFLQASAVIFFLSIGFGLTGVLLGGCLVTIIAFTSLFCIMKKNKIKIFYFKKLKKYLRYSSPLIIVGLSGFILGSFDRLILASTVGPAEVGLYALAAKFALITALLVQPFDMWWTPIRFQTLKHNNGERECVRMIQLGLFYTIWTAAGVSCIAPFLINWIVPSSYYGALQYVPYLTGLMAIHLCTNILNLGCYAGKTATPPMIIDTISAVIACIGYFTFIPIFEAMGAIYATSIALTFRLFVTVMIGQKIQPLPYNFLNLLYCLTPLLVYIIGLITIQSNLMLLYLGIFCGAISIALAITFDIISISLDWKNHKKIAL